MTSDTRATVVICARNAASTIGRAISSAATQAHRIVLVDDHSADDTVALARAAAPIDVVRRETHGTMGETRQFGLDAVSTPYIVWLDADDELLPGRVERLIDALEAEGADLAADGVELFDGRRGVPLGKAPIPDYVRAAPVRLFERMYLPGPGVLAMRTSFARQIGYDASLHGCEDVDFLLRALAAGAAACFLESIGYRLYAYPDSLSRHRDRQRAMYRRALEKHSYARIESLYATARVAPPVSIWALVSIAMFREDHASALDFVARASAAGMAPATIVEPDGPFPYPEQWRVAFQRGTALLSSGEILSAREDLQHACDLLPHPEALNNLGVVYGRLGDRAAARGLFERALAAMPGYADARENLDADAPARITALPLRREAARQDYA